MTQTSRTGTDTAAADAAVQAAHRILDAPLDLAGPGGYDEADVLRLIVAGVQAGQALSPARPAPTTAQVRRVLCQALLDSLCDVDAGPLADTPYRWAHADRRGVLDLRIDPDNTWPSRCASVDVPQLAGDLIAVGVTVTPAARNGQTA